MNIEQLKHLLVANGIPLDEWGKGESKTLFDLHSELSLGESTLSVEDGKVIRTSFGAVANIYYQFGEDILKLREEKQVFSDGRECRRNLDFSIGEKVKKGESSIDAVKRAFREELGIEDELHMTELTSYDKGPVPSVYFPGLFSIYKVDRWAVLLPERLFKLNGYVEVQPDKTSYFSWFFG